LEAHCPADVPAAQWTEAVKWTSNLVVQDFYYPQPEEYPGLQNLNQQLELKKNDPIDLAKLRWIWDEIETACGGPNSVASRFRKVKLMTKGPITDERLPSLWALERCTGLDLSETEITDASVPFLQSLPKLERLDIHNTKITATGAKELQNSRLGLQVFHEIIP
ncbi:MAG: leucine-rich repeat domain-containing protein, partial [Planctomycetota bacterium]|nr:leucine-rich repeat domain-containing protein [Planctomycetota bacterium]